MVKTTLRNGESWLMNRFLVGLINGGSLLGNKTRGTTSPDVTAVNYVPLETAGTAVPLHIYWLLPTIGRELR